MSLVLIGVILYVAVQLGIGFWVSRRIRTEDDYLVAGRSLGYSLAIFTIFATWFGAETVVGAAGRIYTEGLSGGSGDPFGYALCILFMGLFFAVRIWNRKLTTIADFFRDRFSPTTERLVVLLMAPTSLFWAAAQIRAFGQVLSVASGHDLSLTLAAAAGVVIIYTMFGGMLADAWTDLIQGIALIAGLAVLFVAVMTNGGWEAFAVLEPERFRLVGAGQSWLDVLEAWAIPVCGSLFAAELVTRIMASRSPVVARRSALWASAIYVLVGLIPVALGLVGPSLVPGLDHPEQLLPTLASTYLGPALYTVFAGALVSAILSTVDSALLVSSSMVSHNLVVPLLPGVTEAGKVRIARVGVALFGVFAWLLASGAESVYGLVQEASAFGSSGIFVVMIVGLFTPAGSGWSAVTSLLAGVAVWVLGAHVAELDHPFVASLVAAALGFGAGWIAETVRARRTVPVAVRSDTGRAGQDRRRSAR